MANKIKGTVMDLREAEIGKEYIVKDVQTDDDELNAFLFSLGCYSGEPITVIARRKSGLTVAIKDARYNIDNLLAQTILI
jgi:ferrous iron transport protein A